MSQIPPPIPPDPNRPQPLQYHEPRPAGYAIPTVWQAVLGTIATGVLTVGGGFVIGIIALAVVSEAKAGDSLFFLVAGVGSLVFLGAALLLARRLRRSQLYRGWAIGMYIGIGLGALFWGTCAMMLASLGNMH